MKKRIIWSNRNINYDEWRESLIEYRRENEYEDPEDVSDNDVWNFRDESLDVWMGDEMRNLNFRIDGRILAIADLGLWYGRRQGYRMLNDCVNAIFACGYDCNEYYSDGYNIKASCTHHDGTNFYEFRVIREDRNINNLLNDIYNGKEITRKQLNYYTKSLLPYVRKVYGW